MIKKSYVTGLAVYLKGYSHEKENVTGMKKRTVHRLVQRK
jgi:hypothetical protein